MSSLVGAAEGAAGAAPPLIIDPTEWSYLAEGGFHIILRYDGADPKLGGRILRIGKKSLGHSKEEGKEVRTPEGAPATAPAAPDEAGARRKFERGVLIPLLGAQYVQPGDAVTLSREDIDKIHARYLVYNKRNILLVLVQKQPTALRRVLSIAAPESLSLCAGLLSLWVSHAAGTICLPRPG